MSFFFQTINLVAINNLNSEKFSATDGHRVLNLSEASSSHAHGLLYRRHRLSIEKRREDRNGVVVSFYLFFGGGGPFTKRMRKFCFMAIPSFSSCTQIIKVCSLRWKISKFYCSFKNLPILFIFPAGGTKVFPPRKMSNREYI